MSIDDADPCSQILETIPSKRLRQNVGELVFGADVLDGDLPTIDAFPDEVETVGERATQQKFLRAQTAQDRSMKLQVTVSSTPRDRREFSRKGN